MIARRSQRLPCRLVLFVGAVLAAPAMAAAEEAPASPSLFASHAVSSVVSNLVSNAVPNTTTPVAASTLASAAALSLAPPLSHMLGAARLAGQGKFTWFGLELYSAQLWVGARGYLSGLPDAAPLLLSLQYARALSGRRIAEASADEIKKLSLGSRSQRTAWLEKMLALFPNVSQGTKLSALNLPGFGVRFYQGDQVLGEVADTEFGHAFFAIWLSPSSSAPALRQALLRNAAPEPTPEAAEMVRP